MLKNLRDNKNARRSMLFVGLVGATTAVSLLSPSVAFAAEAELKSGSQTLELTHEQLIQVTELQISNANSGTEKFSSVDFLEQARQQIQAEYEAREVRRAEEARIAAEEEARIAAEEAARVENEKKEAAKKAAEAAKKTVSKSPSSVTSPVSPAYSGGGSKDEWLRSAGIPEGDWGYLDKLIARESGWNPNALNSSSGACGLVQALPCSKIPGTWNNPVDALKWGDSYVKGRYGSWANALSHSDSKGWY